MKFRTTDKILIMLFIAGIACAILANIVTGTGDHINIKPIRERIIQQQQHATSVMAQLKNTITHYSVDSILHKRINEKDISYFLVNKNDETIFWTDNSTELTSIPDNNAWHWSYYETINAQGIVCYTNTDAGKLIAFIKIKWNYPFENKQIINKFISFPELDNTIGIAVKDRTDKYAIIDNTGEYLFSFRPSGDRIYNNNIYSFIFILIAFLTALALLGRQCKLLNRKKLSIGYFFVQFIVSLSIVCLILFFSWPEQLFYEKLSSSFDYSSGRLLATAIHMTIISLYLLVQSFLFFRYVETTGAAKKTVLLLLTINGIYFTFISYLLLSLVLHSGTPLAILSLNDFNWKVVWYHLLMFIWGGSFLFLFYKTHAIARKALKFRSIITTDIIIAALLTVLVALYSEYALRFSLFYTLVYTALFIDFYLFRRNSLYLKAAFWTFILTLFFLENSLIISNRNKETKFRIFAENFLMGGFNENDRVTEIMFEELNRELLTDNSLKSFKATQSDLMNQYLTENYFRGYWGKFDIQVKIIDVDQEQHNEVDMLLRRALQVNNTLFYSLPSNESDMSYIGVLPMGPGSNLIAVLSFYPRKNFKSYSFPKFLITSESEIQSTLNISVARYNSNRLIYKTEGSNFSSSTDYIPAIRSRFFRFLHNDQWYYCYQQKNNKLIIKEKEQHSTLNYIVYGAYTFLAYWITVMLIVWIYLRTRNQQRPQSNFAGRYQLAFVLLLLVSFVGIFYVSFSYFSKNYKKKLVDELELKKHYIQNSLQEKYFWTQDLSTVSSQGLNFDLQELSYMYQTDINVYDNYGRLVGSSQPLIYNKNLLSRQISPIPFFGGNPSVNQEEFIGELPFLNGYSDFYNGDFVQIGYISIPLYISDEVVKSEIEDFLSVVIHIYLIIAFLSVVLSFIIGKQLSAPLLLIREKLRKMRLGQRNEKIDYQANNEIGQLVIQYNKTLDELERSAKSLAQTERESAWKTMARQIAHEINNPLTPMKLTIQQLQRTKKMNDERFEEYFERSSQTLIEQIDNLSRIAGSFSNFAKMPEARHEIFDIAAKLYSVIQLFANNADTTKVLFNGEKDNIFVFADPEQMLQVFNNLLKNALQAIPEDKTGIIETTINVTGQQVYISVKDNGKGIDSDLKDKIFVPSFTTKSNGMGLGLAISKNIVELAGGRIWFESLAGEGTTFFVELKRVYPND